MWQFAAWMLGFAGEVYSSSSSCSSSEEDTDYVSEEDEIIRAEREAGRQELVTWQWENMVAQSRPRRGLSNGNGGSSGGDTAEQAEAARKKRSSASSLNSSRSSASSSLSATTSPVSDAEEETGLPRPSFRKLTALYRLSSSLQENHRHRHGGNRDGVDATATTAAVDSSVSHVGREKKEKKSKEREEMIAYRLVHLSVDLPPPSPPETQSGVTMQPAITRFQYHYTNTGSTGESSAVATPAGTAGTLTPLTATTDRWATQQRHSAYMTLEERQHHYSSPLSPGANVSWVASPLGYNSSVVVEVDTREWSQLLSGATSEDGGGNGIREVVSSASFGSPLLSSSNSIGGGEAQGGGAAFVITEAEIAARQEAFRKRFQSFVVTSPENDDDDGSKGNDRVGKGVAAKTEGAAPRVALSASSFATAAASPPLRDVVAHVLEQQSSREELQSPLADEDRDVDLFLRRRLAAMSSAIEQEEKDGQQH